MALPGSATIDTYGGVLNDARPMDDPTTQRKASASNEEANDVAMMTRTSVRAFFTFVGHATTPAVQDHWAQWGDSPGLAPVLTLGITGVIDVEFPETVVDDRGEEHTLVVRAGWANVRGTGRAWVEPHPTETHKAIVHLLDSSGPPSASNLPGVLIDVFVT